MFRGLGPELWRYFAICLFAGVLGLTVGMPVEGILLATFGYLVWILNRTRRLFRWIDKGLKGKPPETEFTIGEIADSLSRIRRRDIRRRGKLRYRLKRYEMLTEALEEGFLILNTDLTLDTWNSSAGRLINLQPSDEGTSIINLIREPRFVSFINQEKFSEPLEISSPIQTGQRLQFRATRFGRDEIVLLVNETSQLRNLEQLRRDFVANVSHELRTPLTVLRGYIETLSDTNDGSSEIVVRAYEQMSQQVGRMQSLADDLVLLARLESDDYERTVEPINMLGLLTEVAREAELVSAGDHKVLMECPADITIEGEKSELHSALSNMVMNAINHNPQGATISVEVAVKSKSLRIVVSDDGIGIDPKHLPRITERFYRVDSGRDSSRGGTGLGLAIVKHVIQQHGGTLNIDSAPGMGTTLSCHFPLQLLMLPEQVNA